MSWEIFKQNILALSNRPDSIPDIDTVARTWAKEYDAAIRRGFDTVNGVSIKTGNVAIMEQLFKAALQRGLSAKSPYDLVGEMGKGVLAYWTGATLNELPIPLLPAPGSVSNSSVTANIVTNIGTWAPGLTANVPEGDDAPETESADVSEHEDRNGYVASDSEIDPKAEEDSNAPVYDNPRPSPSFSGNIPSDFTADEVVISDENLNKIETGPPPKIYGNIGATAVKCPPDWVGKYQNGKIPSSAMIGIERGGRAEYVYNGTGGWYLLHPEAANQYFKLKNQAKKEGIGWTLTSAYRSLSHQASLGSGATIAKVGSSPHGWGLAIDFGQLFRAVGGSGNPSINRRGRASSSLYRWLSNNAPKYGWYNPYRLADGAGVDEMWHWEYWGFYTDKV